MLTKDNNVFVVDKNNKVHKREIKIEGSVAKLKLYASIQNYKSKYCFNSKEFC